MFEKGKRGNSDLKLADREVKSPLSTANKHKSSLIQEKVLAVYLQDYERSLKRLKLSFYTHGDRSGKFLAKKVKILLERKPY